MGFRDQIDDVIMQALNREGITRIAVHSDAQAELGERAAQRVGGLGATVRVSFEIIPEDQQDQYPVGTILVT